MKPRGQFFETLLQDVRFGLRMMRKRPAFTGVAILTLAVAICANVVVFAVLNALVLRPYRATPRDPWVLGGVLVTMMLVGLLAAGIPVRRALTANPLTLMREE
jgi:predicted lysophospholipase L1 biosynthesis ABC-type transport system permease subunit